MKCLSIIQNPEDNGILKNLFKKFYPQIDYVGIDKPEDAFDILSIKGPFHFVIIDASFKNHPPSAIAVIVLEAVGELPALFLGTKQLLADRVDSELYNSHPQNSLLLLPILPENLKSVMNPLLEWLSRAEQESSIIEVNDEDFLPIKIRNFFLFNQLPYDVFVRVTSAKYSKAIAKDEMINEGIILKFVQRNIKEFWLKKDDKIKFLEESLRRLSVSLKGTLKLSESLKIQTIAISVIHEYIKALGINEKIAKFITLVMENIQLTYELSGGIKKILAGFPLLKKDISEKSILMSYCCEAFTFEMGWKSDMSRQKLILSSFFHDLSLEQEELCFVTEHNDPLILSLKPEDQKKYFDHVARGAQMIELMPNFSDVSIIIEQHHEWPTGDGFPRGINSFKISSLAAPFIMVNILVSHLMKTQFNRQGIESARVLYTEEFSKGIFKDSYKGFVRMLDRI